MKNKICHDILTLSTKLNKIPTLEDYLSHGTYSDKISKYSYDELIEYCEFKPLNTCTKVVALNDVHVPFQDHEAIKIAFNFIKAWKPNYIILNGDILDMYACSSFDKSPDRKDSFMEELEEGNAFLDEVEAISGDAQIVFLEGNHEYRFDRYLKNKARALYGIVTLPGLLHMDDRDWTYLKYGKFFTLGKLNWGHGYRVSKHSGYSARSHYDSFGLSMNFGHCHRVGQYHVTNYQGDFVVTEGGCLCQLTPEYIPTKPNWQQAITTSYVFPSGEFVSAPNVIQPVNGIKQMMFEGNIYTADGVNKT